VLDVAGIGRVGRSSRPGVYEFCSDDGAKAAFWLSQGDGDVRTLFLSLHEMNPGIDMSAIYGASKLWWKGLPAPQSFAEGSRALGRLPLVFHTPGSGVTRGQSILACTRWAGLADPAHYRRAGMPGGTGS